MSETRPPIRFQALADLTNASRLGALCGPVVDLALQPMETVGFSGSRHERLLLRLESGASVRLVFKRTELNQDWTAYRTGDVLGREAALIADPEFAGVWEVFARPYVAFATEGDAEGLLMVDLTPHLLPDVRAPIETRIEDALLARIAALHARFWESPPLARPWLCRAGDLISVLGPATGVADPRRTPSPALLARVQDGWSFALGRLPARVAEVLSDSPDGWAERCASLPRTLIHGDVKVANFAPLPDGRIAAFDWAMTGAAPPTVDLGWYLAVNASRLSRSKEAVMARYRALLEEALGGRLDEATWTGLERIAILSGGTMLLWSKAIGLQSAAAGAEEEWAWWVDRLSAVC